MSGDVTIESLELARGRPLLVVDVDEVIVGLATHLDEFARRHGYELRLTTYQLDGALRRADGSRASDAEFRDIFERFFREETRHQRAYPGASDSLARLSRCAQVVILTNVPAYARNCRVHNLESHGIRFPLIANAGPKGPALEAMRDRIGEEAPMVFIDDSPYQIESAARSAARVTPVHFIGDPELRSLLGPSPHSPHFPAHWPETEAIAHRLLCGCDRID